MKKIIIFGAGHDGRELLGHLGSHERENVAYFCDNDREKAGTFIDGIEVIPFEKLREIHKDYTVFMAVGVKEYLREQFDTYGMDDYVVYENDESKDVSVRNDDPVKALNPDSLRNKLMREFVARCTDTMPIENFEEFRELVKEVNEKLSFANGVYATYESLYTDSMIHGHGKTLMDYAGITPTDYVNFPCVCHGPFHAGHYPVSNFAMIVCGEYDRHLHNSKYPYVPVFPVGPYIQYAKPVYDEETLQKIKNRSGKTAAIFLAHNSRINTQRLSTEPILKKIIDEYTKQYEKVMVCAYCSDVECEEYEILHRAGIQVVSAGLRFDDRFLRRLRTILELADDVIVHGFTTTIMYAAHMGKNIHVHDAASKVDRHVKNIDVISRIWLIDTKEHAEICDLFDGVYGESPRPMTDSDRELLNRYYGFSIRRTPEELRLIYEICREIWENCGHILRDYAVGVYRTYQKYQDEYDFEKLVMLSYGTGNRFYHA